MSRLLSDDISQGLSTTSIEALNNYNVQEGFHPIVDDEEWQDEAMDVVGSDLLKEGEEQENIIYDLRDIATSTYVLTSFIITLDLAEFPLAGGRTNTTQTIAPGNFDTKLSSANGNHS